MPGPAPRALRISHHHRRDLCRVVARHRAAFSLVVRARIILHLAAGHGPARVAALVGCSDRLVRKWRARWEVSPGLPSLHDAPRAGAPPRIDLLIRCEVVKLACSRQGDCRLPFECLWSQHRLAEALARSSGVTIRLRRVTRQWWALDVSVRPTIWEPVPGVRAPIPNVLNLLVASFPWLLAPRD